MSDTHRLNLIAQRPKQSGATPGSVYQEGFSPWPPASCRAPQHWDPWSHVTPPSPPLSKTHPPAHTLHSFKATVRATVRAAVLRLAAHLHLSSVYSLHSSSFFTRGGQWGQYILITEHQLWQPCHKYGSSWSRCILFTVCPWVDHYWAQ